MMRPRFDRYFWMLLIALSLGRQPAHCQAPGEAEGTQAATQPQSAESTARQIGGVDALGRPVTLEQPFSFVTIKEIVGGQRQGAQDSLASPSGERIQELSIDRPGPFYADADSVIQIAFNTDRLLKNMGFFSSAKLSLEAQLNTRPVEVEGYSEVGKERTTVGLTGMSPDRFILNIQHFQADLPFAAKDNLEDLRFFYERTELIAKILKEFLADGSSAAAFSNAIGVSPTAAEAHLANLQVKLEALKQLNPMKIDARYRDRYSAEGAAQQELKTLEEQRSIATKDLTTIADEMEAPNLTANRLRRLMDQQAKLQKRLAEFDRKIEVESEKLAAATKEIGEILEPAYAVESEIQALDSDVNRDLRRQATGLKEFREVALQSILFYPSADAAEPKAAPDVRKPLNDVEARAQLLKAIQEYWGQSAAGESRSRHETAIAHIYRNLVPGRVVLSREQARRGDVLYLYLRVVPDGVTKADTERPVRFTLAEIQVEEFGLYRQVIDSFLLVKRKDEPAGDDVSPSNFKGAPGASLIWGVRRRPDGARAANRLFSVSYGLNVSYVDFDTTKDIEIGVGPVIGFADDQIVLTAGWNLNGDTKRFYWGVGFSFAKIKEKVTSKKSDTGG